MSLRTIRVIVLLCIFGGALLGFFLHRVLPEKHVNPVVASVERLVMTTVAFALADGTSDWADNRCKAVSRMKPATTCRVPCFHMSSLWTSRLAPFNVGVKEFNPPQKQNGLSVRPKRSARRPRHLLKGKR